MKPLHHGIDQQKWKCHIHGTRRRYPGPRTLVPGYKRMSQVPRNQNMWTRRAAPQIATALLVLVCARGAAAQDPPAPLPGGGAPPAEVVYTHTCQKAYLGQLAGQVKISCPTGLYFEDDDASGKHCTQGDQGRNCTQAECCRTPCSAWTGSCDSENPYKSKVKTCGEECNADNCCIKAQCLEDICGPLGKDMGVTCKLESECQAKMNVVNEAATPAKMDALVTCVLDNSGDDANACYGNPFAPSARHT